MQDNTWVVILTIVAACRNIIRYISFSFLPMNNFYLTEPCQMIPSSYTTVHTLLPPPPKKHPKQVTGKKMKGHAGMVEPKKSNQTRYYTAMLLRITIPTSLNIFPINPQHITFPTCHTIHIHSHLNTMFSHTSISWSHYNHRYSITNPLQQPALYTQHCSHHNTIRTSSNKRLQLCTCTMQTTSISLMHTTK